MDTSVHPAIPWARAEPALKLPPSSPPPTPQQASPGASGCLVKAPFPAPVKAPPGLWFGERLCIFEVPWHQGLPLYWGAKSPPPKWLNYKIGFFQEEVCSLLPVVQLLGANRAAALPRYRRGGSSAFIRPRPGAAFWGPFVRFWGPSASGAAPFLGRKSPPKGKITKLAISRRGFVAYCRFPTFGSKRGRAATAILARGGGGQSAPPPRGLGAWLRRAPPLWCAPARLPLAARAVTRRDCGCSAGPRAAPAASL